MGTTSLTADRCTGRALALALTPGLDPILAVAELVEIAGGNPVALDLAAARFRACLREGPSECLRLALDLVEESLAYGPAAPVTA